MKRLFNSDDTRRNFLINSGALIGLTALLGPGNLLAGSPKEPKAAEVTPTEDLMREHGVLRRIMLIYEEICRRLQDSGEFPLPVLADASGIIRRFIQDYHEKDEENYLFPRFEKAGRLVDLIKVLRQQHEAGRRLMYTVNGQIKAGATKNPADRARLADYLRAFNRIYRPHAAREDTVLYPAFRTLVSPREFEAIGDKFEEKELALFGEGGFEKVVAQVAGLEKTLGLYELSQFTPKI